MVLIGCSRTIKGCAYIHPTLDSRVQEVPFRLLLNLLGSFVWGTDVKARVIRRKVGVLESEVKARSPWHSVMKGADEGVEEIGDAGWGEGEEKGVVWWSEGGMAEAGAERLQEGKSMEMDIKAVK